MFFYANDRDEPRHVHVEREKMVAKFGLTPFAWNAVAIQSAGVERDQGRD
jgi:hypothetical protein